MKQPVRRIRSFVRREGRMTDGQKRAIENYWQTFGINFSASVLDLDRIFHRPAPKILDIGTGTGATTVFLAKHHPENDYFAVEVHRPGVGSLLRQIAENNLTNIRVSNHDVVDVLKFQIPENSLDLVYIFFPDPWPKKRHHKRRLINETFLHMLKVRLKANARVFIATDWSDYAGHIVTVFNRIHDYFNLAGGTRPAPRPYWHPLTRFEQRGCEQQYRIWNFVFARRCDQNISLKSRMAVNSSV